MVMYSIGGGVSQTQEKKNFFFFLIEPHVVQAGLKLIV